MDAEQQPEGPRAILARDRLGGDGLRVHLRRLQRGEDHAGAGNRERGRHHHRLTPAERGGDQGEEGGQRHLADVAGEIVGAQCGARAQAGIGAGDEGRGNRMLRAAAQPSECQARDHAVERASEAGQSIADGHECGAEGQDMHAAQLAGEPARRDLSARHRAGIDRLQSADGSVAQAELRLQERIEDVQKIGETVMQRMGPAAHREGLSTGGWRGGSDCHGTVTILGRELIGIRSLAATLRPGDDPTSTLNHRAVALDGTIFHRRPSDHSAVVGSIVDLTCETLLAGNPPWLA